MANDRQYYVHNLNIKECLELFEISTIPSLTTLPFNGFPSNDEEEDFNSFLANHNLQEDHATTIANRININISYLDFSYLATDSYRKSPVKWT